MHPATARCTALVLVFSAYTSVQAAEPAATPPSSAPAQFILPHELSPWGMFLAADTIVKGIMIGLMVASFLVWTIWLGKFAQILFARRKLRQELASITGQTSIDTAIRATGSKNSLARGMLEAARLELRAAVNRVHAPERISSRLGEIEAEVNKSIRGGMSFLASVGATAPFIGLFGTVWGIMNSFIGISKAQTTNLAVVAPGIAEALLATAIGLVAAIPAVILYNQLGQGVSSFRRLVRETRGEVGRIVSREIHDQSEKWPLAPRALAAE